MLSQAHPDLRSSENPICVLLVPWANQSPLVKPFLWSGLAEVPCMAEISWATEK